MATATQHPPHAPHGHGHGDSPSLPAAHDPEHDINAKATTIWVVAWAVLFFLALYFMLPLFERVLQIELDKKKAHLPNTELEELRSAESEFLKGTKGKATKKSIDDVMREMVKR